MPAWQTISPPSDAAACRSRRSTRWMGPELRRAYLRDRRALHWTIRRAINEAVQRAIDGVFAEPSGYYGLGLRELLGGDAAGPIIRQITGKEP